MRGPGWGGGRVQQRAAAVEPVSRTPPPSSSSAPPHRQLLVQREDRDEVNTISDESAEWGGVTPVKVRYETPPQRGPPLLCYRTCVEHELPSDRGLVLGGLQREHSPLPPTATLLQTPTPPPDACCCARHHDYPESPWNAPFLIKETNIVRRGPPRVNGRCGVVWQKLNNDE